VRRNLTEGDGQVGRTVEAEAFERRYNPIMKGKMGMLSLLLGIDVVARSIPSTILLSGQLFPLGTTGCELLYTMHAK